MKKWIIVLVVLCVFVGAGLVWIVPAPGAGAPRDFSEEEYIANEEKNNALIVKALEATGEPTLRAAMGDYQKVARSIDFYPTAFDTVVEAGRYFDQRDKIPVCKEWRLERFLKKYYPNAWTRQEEYENAARQSAESGAPLPKTFQSQTVVYKDGSVITFGPGGMSVDYKE